MKIQINLLTRFLEIRSSLELKIPQKRKAPARPKSSGGISQTVNIITQK